jgi:RNA methyltransferase, TrmH family
MKSIASRANAGFRMLKDLVGSSRDRRKHQAAWVEGERLCQSFSDTGKRGRALVISDQLDVDPMVARYGDRADETWVLHASLFREISQLETSPGWGLVIPEPQNELASVACDVVVFDRIQDPGNVGSVLRSAAAAGIHQAWCITGTVDPWSAKVMRAAMGAHFAIEIVSGLEEAFVIDQAKALGISLFSTANHVGATSLFSEALALTKPCAWVFGQEGEGVSKTLQAVSTRVVIPQSNTVESLNVAAAASVCLFETKRRRLHV